VASSRSCRNDKACSRLSPHILCTGRNPLQTKGRSGVPKILQRLSSSSCTHRTPAGLPFGIPGIGDEIEGAIQQAPQPARQFNMVIFTFETIKTCVGILCQKPYFVGQCGGFRLPFQHRIGRASMQEPVTCNDPQPNTDTAMKSLKQYLKYMSFANFLVMRA
jgi:hypothetical protein